jgi:hypothetical protein
MLILVALGQMKMVDGLGIYQATNYLVKTSRNAQEKEIGVDYQITTAYQ